MTGPLSNLPLLRQTATARASSWDRTGGNDHSLHIAPNEHAQLARIDQPGIIRHVWMTITSRDPHFLRQVILRMFWDDECSASIEVPIGDFFGLGHGQTRNFTSLPLQMSPESGRAFNCWFPMPFEQARIEVGNDCEDRVDLTYHVDYELTRADDKTLGRFHAQWRRENPCDGIAEDGLSNADFQFGGRSLEGRGNYVILAAEGQGHYVGCNLSVENLRWVERTTYNWYGEGADMIFVDGEAFPPTLHGTGTADYFSTARCPTQEYCAPYHGVLLGGETNWGGKSSFYRFHIEDPVRFLRSIRVTIEHGHANRRSDDLASTAYWYQAEPHAPFPPLPHPAERLPRRAGGAT